ncbi:MAG: hypothetical protein JJU28_02365 [Cyclobacteriaceae bacterium]|nr:hypothetical protein [Cyclobacteriaceae bacterium]
MDENKLIKRCAELIEKKCGRRHIDRWTGQRFTDLSEKIAEETGKHISDSTLKRIFGKKKTAQDYTPQVYTKDALANFIGFKNWEDFASDTESSPVLHPGWSPNHFKILGFVLLVIVTIIAIWYFIPDKQVEILCSNDRQQVPYTAVFLYEIPAGDDSYSLEIMPGQAIRLHPDKDRVTEFIKSAGYQPASLYKKEKLISQIYIHSLSSTWQAGYSKNDFAETYTPFEIQDLHMQDTSVFLDITNPKISTQLPEEPFFMDYRLSDTFNIDLQNLSLQVDLLNNASLGGKVCYDKEILIVSDTGTISLRFLQPGCYRYAKIVLGKQELTGRYDDLTAFAVNSGDWGSVQIQSLNHQVMVSYNGNVILETGCEDCRGSIKAITIRFYGNGAFRNFQLREAEKVE